MLWKPSVPRPCHVANTHDTSRPRSWRRIFSVGWPGDHAFITALLDTKIIAPAFGGAIEGEIRVSLGCRKRGGKWYIIQYHESRQLELAKEAGVTYVGAQAS